MNRLPIPTDKLLCIVKAIYDDPIFSISRRDAYVPGPYIKCPAINNHDLAVEVRNMI